MGKESIKHSVFIREECKTRFLGEDSGYYGICVELCPEVFEISKDKARIKDGAEITLHIGKIRKAIENCPIDAIILNNAFVLVLYKES